MNPDAAPFRARFLSWLPALLAMGAIFWLSSIPGDRLPLPGFRFADKLAHFTAYALLGFLIGMRLRLRRHGSPVPPGFDFRGLLIGILYGASDEVHQLFVPMRQFAVGDFAADALGAAAGIWLAGLSGGSRARDSRRRPSG